ncbi:MAG: sulfite exporter TauE/SafE family protein [Paracoccaceae bacterium]
MLADTDMVMLVAAVFLFAGVIKGTIGIGLPTVSVGLMSQFLPPHTAIAVVVFPILFSNFWQVFRAKAGLKTLRKYWVLVTLLALSLWLTTFFAAQVSADFLLGAIGLAIVVFAASSLIGTPPKLPDHLDRAAQVVTGLAAGVLGGFTSIWAPPFVTYLIARRTDSEEFVRAAGLFIFIGAIPLTIGYWQSGLLNGMTAPLSAGMIIPTLIGFTIGEVLRRHLSPASFRQALLWIFLLMGLNLLRRAFF